MIIVSGATGQLGRAIVENLLTRLPASELGVSVRDASQTAFAERKVRVRQASYGDRAALEHAYQGAHTVLVMSSNSSGADVVAHHRSAIEAAVAAGAQRIVYTSHVGSSLTSHFPPMVDHAETEALLETCGVPFTSLRNGYYAASGLMLMGPAMTTGEAVAPGDGPVSWTTHADLAEAAAIVLSQPGRIEGISPPLTGSVALDLSGIAEVATEVTGKPIRRVVVEDEPFIAGLKARGAPEWRVELMRGVFKAMRAGEFARVDPALEALLGRAPQTMRDAVVASLRP